MFSVLIETTAILRRVKERSLTGWNTFCVHMQCSTRSLGYIQGMSDLLSPILFVMNDEIDAFWCFKTYMDKMKKLLEASDTGMKYELKAMSSLLAFADPEFHSYLTSEPEFLESYQHRYDEHNLVFCFRWFMLNFKREFDFNSILRLWEVSV